MVSVWQHTLWRDGLFHIGNLASVEFLVRSQSITSLSDAWLIYSWSFDWLWFVPAKETMVYFKMAWMMDWLASSEVCYEIIRPWVWENFRIFQCPCVTGWVWGFFWTIQTQNDLSWNGEQLLQVVVETMEGSLFREWIGSCFRHLMWWIISFGMW